MTEQTKQEVKSLRVLSPSLYKYMLNEMTDRHNIHTYDVQATAVEEADGLRIMFRYGEQFAHSNEVYLTYDTIEARGEELNAFIRETADVCKEVMVADYFKMMKP